MGSDESTPGLLRVLVDRCSELEATQASLKAQLHELVAEEKSDRLTSYSGGLTIPGNFRGKGPYGHVLQCIGHAVYVSRAPSGEITFWNHAAEKLFGWKDYEVLGRCFWDFLIDEQYTPALNRIMEKLRFGHSWSGQFPFKKRSGEVFMAIVTKSPLYEDGQLVGVITVSSDAALFNIANQNNHHEQRKHNSDDMKRIQWHPKPQIASVPQMASSISDLASKVLLRGKRGDDGDGSVSDAVESHSNVAKSASEGGCSCHKEESVIAQPAKIAAKLLSKFQIKSGGGNNNHGEANEGNFLRNNFMRKAKHEQQPCCSHCSMETTTPPSSSSSLFPGKRTYAQVNEYMIITPNGNALEKALLPSESFSKECHECLNEPKLEQPCLPASSLHVDDDKGELKAGEVGGGGGRNHASSEDSRGSSHESASSKADFDAHLSVDPDIRWEDLHLGEEVGQGSYAVVYHGLWKGSDVAIKVYFGKDYNEGTLLDYKKEIDIMRRLRHPNVLLFMGACYSQERLAIVTEFLPRGSLFKILHRSNQVLDMRKRLKMALDVARGMNYLHRRHPPIVHRDLKSSNLLVDKNWTVKVGDFGLSKLKNATFLTAKSGGGTPQWMAPEVLRNDPSNEKSDVFSFGVILWELMTVKVPWANLNSVQVVGVVGFMDRRLEIPDNLDLRISSMITDCWQSNPEHRPSFQDVMDRISSILQSVPPSLPTHGRRNPPS